MIVKMKNLGQFTRLYEKVQGAEAGRNLGKVADTASPKVKSRKWGRG